MSKRYLRSDLSEQEAHFLTCGNGFFGEENTITGLYKLIGKFNELKELGRKEDLSDYAPDKDIRFKYENLGITKLSTELKIKYGTKKFSRWNFKTLSRKWCLTPVVISFNCKCIITELITYINHDIDLKSACEKYLSSVSCKWEDLMPIQYDFLSTRFTDQHKNYRIAGKMINELSTMSFN